MSRTFKRALVGGITLLAIALPGAMPQSVKTQSGKASKDTATKAQFDTAPRFEIYGFAQGDAIGDFKSNNPDWFDVNRPSKLPATQDEFGHSGHSWVSARQSRFGCASASGRYWPRRRTPRRPTPPSSPGWPVRSAPSTS